MPSLGATKDGAVEDGVKVPRGSVRVNPVTGKMQRIEPKVGKKGGNDSDEEMVREGCMMIPKKYLTGATDAGLGSSDGMYSNMGAVRRELQSSKNTGQKAGGGGGGRKPSQPTVKTTLMNGGSRAVHQISQSSSSSTGATGAIVPRRNNIKHVVQGRSRTMRNGTVGAKEAEESRYSKEKGVVSTFGGATSAKTRKYQEDKRDKAKKGIAQISSGSGGRSFVKLDKGAGAGGVGKPKVSAAPGGISGSMSAVRKKNASGGRASSTNKLGGGATKASSSSAGGGTGKSSAPKATTSSSSSSVGGGQSARGSRSIGVTLGGGGAGGSGGAGGAAAQRAARAKFFEDRFAAKP